MENIRIEMLWEYACCGDVESLKSYYENGGEPNRRYYAFGGEHSLIMGAFRNNQFEAVEYMLSVGETVTKDEMIVFNRELQQIMCLRKIVR
jgi:hypothetical protein